MWRDNCKYRSLDGALHVNHRGIALTPAFEFEVSDFFRHFGVLLAYVADGIGRVARVVPGDCNEGNATVAMDCSGNGLFPLCFAVGTSRDY
jgi:hypothetical protein